MKLRTILSTAGILAAAGALLTACADEREFLSGEGSAQLKLSVSTDTKAQSRAFSVDEAEALSEQAIIWISNSKGPVRKYSGFSSVPAEGVKLLADHYLAEVWTGDSVSASWDKKWYKGSEEFDIRPGQNTSVKVVASIANTVVSVNYEDGVKEMLLRYSMTVGHRRGELVFDGDTQDKGYFMMPSKDKNLQWNLEGELANGTVYTRNGVIENAKPGTEYIITVINREDDTPEGGGYFDIVIDERTIDVEDVIAIEYAPQIEGYDFDIDEHGYYEMGRCERRSVWMYGSRPLASVTVTGAALSAVSGETLDLTGASEGDLNELRNRGIEFVTPTWDDEKLYSSAKINFDPVFLNELAAGSYELAFTVSDEGGKTSTKTWAFTISDAPVMTESVNVADIWATTATVGAVVLKSDCTNPGIEYRAAGGEWMDAGAVLQADGTTLKAQLAALIPGATYEFRAYADGYDNGEIFSFTTETAPQLPNAGFESWQTSSSPYLIYGTGESMFWDSGNHGSATMSKNVTVPDSDKKHSGNYSIRLNSQFVGVGIIGKFAAGNVFIGEYLETSGTDGVLGWGRAWTSRPKALKGYIHYTPAAITDVGDGAPSGVSKGDLDTGIIYIAILDSSLKTHNGKSYPVIVKTKSSERTLFSKDDANVIAYGELVLTEATQGDAMVEFTIPIEYYRTDIKASNIMITASASRYGDYFTGGPSTLYIDDLELVY